MLNTVLFTLSNLHAAGNHIGRRHTKELQLTESSLQLQLNGEKKVRDKETCIHFFYLHSFLFALGGTLPLAQERKQFEEIVTSEVILECNILSAELEQLSMQRQFVEKTIAVQTAEGLNQCGVAVGKLSEAS